MSRGKMTEEDGKASLNRVHYTAKMKACHEADVIIEAASENLKIWKSRSPLSVK